MNPPLTGLRLPAAERWLASRRVGPAGPAVVLTGGAALASFEAGVADVLARSAPRPSLLVGASSGALNAGYWAYHPSPDAGVDMAAIWRSAAGLGIFPRRPLHMMRRLLRDVPLGDPRPLRNALLSIFGKDHLIEEAAIPLAIVATDLVTGRPVILRRGPLIPALLASTAVPGYYPPVRIDGHLLVDGGVVANACLESVVEAGPRDAVLVELQAPASEEQLDGARSILEQALTILLARQSELERRLASRRLRLAVVRLSPARRPHPWDFGSTELLFAMGREAGERLMARHLVGGRVRPGIVDEAGLEGTPGDQLV
ncbi:MAG: patatin-like phospholipase family protein [Candidatus Dormibacteraeota bacterium]|nr:patatin-like phospholipase family protein [Candidatus Dormibacteraeota bacterium]